MISFWLAGCRRASHGNNWCLRMSSLWRSLLWNLVLYAQDKAKSIYFWTGLVEMASYPWYNIFVHTWLKLFLPSDNRFHQGRVLGGLTKHCLGLFAYERFSFCCCRRDQIFWQSLSFHRTDRRGYAWLGAGDSLIQLDESMKEWRMS